MGVVDNSQTSLKSDTSSFHNSTSTTPSIYRTSIVKLRPNKKQEEQLKLLCSISTKLWNEITYTRRQQFFEIKIVDLKGTYKEFQEKYSPLIGIKTTQAILNKNDQVWKAFFSFLKLSEEGKLKPFMRIVNPPGYRKENKSRKLWTVIDKSQFIITDNKIIINGLGAIGKLEVEYVGLVHLKGEQWLLEIHYDQAEKIWYAHILFLVKEKAVRRKWRQIPLKPKGNLRAGIDLGINNLMAIYVENGASALVNGRPLKSIIHYIWKRISEYEKQLKRQGLHVSRQYRLIFKKGKRRARSYINTKVRRVIEWLYEKGVSTIYVGYPRYISLQKGDFNISDVWNYYYVIERLRNVAEEYGMEVILVNEAHTSSTCPIHGKGCGDRIMRGLFKCTTLNKVFNADIVGAINILKKSITLSPSRDRGNRLEA